MTERPLSDAEILRILDERTHAAAELMRLHEAIDEEAEGGEGPTGEPCPRCGEPALTFSECETCGEEGCLPRDDWQPGWADPCLTRCARCAREVHVDCAGVDEAGNRVCCGPRRAADELD